MRKARPEAPPRRARRRRHLLAVGALALAVALGAPTVSAATKNKAGTWTTYGASTGRDALQPVGPALGHLHVAWHFGPLAGPIYGEPLIDAGTVYVATEVDTVVALSARSGARLWRTVLGTPVPASMLPCGDIAPSVGVTSTMALDPARRELFASAAVLVGGRIRHELVALDPASGRVLWRRVLDLPHADPAALLQRAALALDRGEVLVGFGGNYGDCAAYRGTLVAVNETGRGPLRSYVVRTSHGGAIWAPAGVSVAPSGRVFAATGNGASTTAYDEGDSVLALSPSLRLLATFAPTNWRTLNATDGDLGSNAPMLLPGGRALIAGKNAVASLLSVATPTALRHPLATLPACFSIGGDAYLAPLAYLACPNATLLALHVGARSLSVAWHGPPGTSGSPTVAGGLVWVLGGGELHGLAPRSGRQLVAMPAIATERYVAPSAAEGLLVLGGTNAVEAFAGPGGWQR